MWLLITFITLWAIAPGPVFVLTINEARKYGSKAGIAISVGATATSVLMVIAALAIQTTGFLRFLESSRILFIEQIGAIGIILMGVLAGYKCLTCSDAMPTDGQVKSRSQIGFLQGMCMMATNIPQALIFYNVIMPQTVSASNMFATIITLGSLKVLMIFGFHSGVAVMADRYQDLVNQNRFKKPVEVVLAVLLVAMGTNILF